MTNVDLLIKNGRLIDPSRDLDGNYDLAVKDKKIYKVGKNLELTPAEVYDASGCIVTPGLIDAHVHCYEYATPLGINPDATCLARGVTTVIDAGSAGACTFPGLRKYVIDRSKTRVKCLLHIAQHGLAASGCAGWAPGGESDTLAVLDERSCSECINKNRDVIVGVKLRLATVVCADGRNENEAYRRSFNVAASCEVPLMVHHSKSGIPTQSTPGHIYSCPGDMRRGDIYTHTYHGKISSIIDERTRQLHSDVIGARERGVIFDVGHGASAFNWKVAELATGCGFWPDLISTDLHTQNTDGPVYDLPTVMTKFLYLGMPLPEIIRAVTSAPADAYGLSDEIGSLSTGKDADITVLKLRDCDVKLEDAQGQCRRVTSRIMPVAVWRAGVGYPVTSPSIWPNPESRKRIVRTWDECIVRDSEKPSI